MTDPHHPSVTRSSPYLDSKLSVKWTPEFLFAMLNVLYESRTRLTAPQTNSLQRLQLVLREFEVQLVGAVGWQAATMTEKC